MRRIQSARELVQAVARCRWPTTAATDGQVLVIFAAGLVAFVAMVGLVIDGGNAFAMQRATQNGTDAAAEAGATQMLRRLARVPAPSTGWNAAVFEAVRTTAATNGITNPVTATYTDRYGNLIAPVPDDAGNPPSGAQGVQVVASRTFSTYFAGIVGLSTITTTTQATAVTGVAVTAPPATLMPITIPLALTSCDGTNKSVYYGDWVPNKKIAIPLCQNSPGNYGFVDWTYPGGGTSELIGAITSPSNRQLAANHWYHVSQPGNTNASGIPAALAAWQGQDIYLPVFWAQAGSPPGVCPSEPLDLTQLDSCPDLGSGSWYYFVAFASFHLDDAYITGDNSAACNDWPSLTNVPVGGNGATSCLVGQFNGPIAIGSGNIGGEPTYSFEALAVQLIK